MILELKHIYKNYMRGKTEVPVLRDINLSVEKGEYVSIMGPSGSGKTTLMNLIGCLDVPTSGTYELDGKDLKDYTDDGLAEVRNKYIGFVFQHFYLMPKMDALDNVALPLLYADVPLKERQARAEEALKAVGLGERIHFLPSQLSGGQCQRVAIARAMVTKPALLLADEPTGALDTKAGNQIMEIFRRLSDEGMTIIMITHEPGIAECADRTLHILDGELKTSDDTAEQRIHVPHHELPEEPEAEPVPEEKTEQASAEMPEEAPPEEPGKKKKKHKKFRNGGDRN